MTQLPFALWTYSPCGIIHKDMLTDAPLTVDAHPECSVLQSVDGIAQFDETWFALERKKSVQFVKREFALDEGFPGVEHRIVLLKLFVEGGEYRLPHCLLALDHGFPPGLTACGN